MRVTEILDYFTEPELVRWIENNSKSKRKAIQEEALRIGSAVDLLVQQDIKDGGYLVPEGDQAIVNCMKGWEKFKKDYPEFVSSVKEMQTELKDGEIIGHPDFIHENGITDLKCASGIRPKYWTQTAKYFQMKYGFRDGFLAILRLDKKDPDGNYEYVKIDDFQFIMYEIKVFEAYYTAFNHAKQTREQLRKQLEEEI